MENYKADLIAANERPLPVCKHGKRCALVIRGEPVCEQCLKEREEHDANPTQHPQSSR